MRRLTIVLLSVLALSATVAVRDAAARAFVIPHILEKSGTITNTTFTFDTTLFITYSPGLASGKTPKGAGVSLYLYDDTGKTLKGGGTNDVCNPCSFGLDGQSRKRTIVLDDLIMAAGGFGGAAQMTGFAVITITGDDKNVAIQGFVVNSHTGPFDLSYLPLPVGPTKE
jgi:hypothetical protein